MSEAHHPSYFLQQPEELDGNYYDDILGQNTFDVDNFDVDFGNNEHYPEEATSDQNIGPVKDHLNHKQPQAGLAHKEKKVQVDQEESGEDREDLSTLQNLATAYDQLNHEGPQAALSSEECQIDSDPNEFFGDRDDFSNLQKPSTQGSFNNGQLEDSVANGQQQFGSEFNANDWNIYENHIGNGGLSEIPETEAHHQQRILKRLEKGRHEGRQNRAHKHVSALQYEQYSHGSFGTPLNPSQLVVDSQQQLAVNTPGIDSARGTASMPREMTHGPVLGTSSKLSNIAGYPTFVNVPGSSGGMNIMINSSLDQDHGSREEENEEDEEDEEDDVPHQPTFETYGEHDPLIVQDPRQEKRGLTGRRNGQQVWFNPDTSKWQPSASHHDMREILIARAQAEYPNDRYLHPDTTDGLPHGETAFFKPHQYRGPDRNDCADELFAWRVYIPKKDEKGNPVKKDKPKSTRKNPGFMFEGDKILLDPHNNPVVNHTFIPLTLSTLTDGSKLQEMALHEECQQADLWARMPRWEQTKDKNGNSTVREIRSKNTRINMPMTRFREKKGTIAGSDRECSEVIRIGLLMFYHSHGFDPVAAGNSTKAFPRDLAPWEVKQARLGNAANFGKRAGGRAVNTEARQKKYQKLLDSINKGQKKQAAQGGGDARQRRLGDEDAGSQDFNAGREKRGRRGQEADAGFVSWDEQYTDQHGSSIFEDGQNGYALQGHLHHHEEHANFQASTSPQEHSNAYGAPKAPFQYPNLQSQPLPGQSQSNFSRNYPSIGTPFTPVENNLQQAPYSGVPMQPGRSIYEEEENRLRVQELDNKGPIHRALPTGPRQKRMKTPATQMLLNNGVTIQDNNPTGQYPQSYTGTERSRNVGAGEPFQTLRAETHYEPAKYDHHNMIQNGPIMNNGLLYPPHGQAGSNHYVLPVQHQQSFEGAGHAPKPRCNTIGPGGRNVHQAPEQILGRRGREETGEDENRETGAYPLGDSVSDVQANPDLDERSLHKHKRQRNNALPGTEPRPQRRHQKERTPRTRYYGAGGAPAPLLPPEEFFATTESGSDFDGDMEGLLRSSQKVFGKLQSGSDSNDDIPFDFDDDAGGQVWENYAPNGGTQDTEQDTYQPFGRDQVVDGSAYTSDQPRNTAYDEVYEGQDVTAASNQNVIQAMGGAPTRHSEYSQHRSGVNLPQQVLGKHGREDRLGEGQQGTYVPEQSREDQGPGEQDGRGEEDADEPKLKRRRMPASEGYHSPPAQAPKAAMVQKARKAERDVHLAPPQFNIQEPMAEISEAPQVEEADLTPSQIIIGGSVINLNEFAEAEDTDVPRTQPNVEEDVPETDGAPLVADAQGPDPPRAPAPARTEREVRTDIRDVRPENAWQSQSLNNALRYTREAFFEWTGEEAPATNLEGSYNVQYRVLRAVFKAWWKSEKNPQRSEPLPELYRMKAWSGEVEDWKAPENVEHLFDPMRRGRWAARNEDGSLKKPQFRWNVEDYSWYDAKDEEQL